MTDLLDTADADFGSHVYSGGRRLWREPMYVLTDDAYNALGAVLVEDGRFVGHDTLGRTLFERDDKAAAMAAATNIGVRMVSSAWYGVSELPYMKIPAPLLMPDPRLFETRDAKCRCTGHVDRSCPAAKGLKHWLESRATAREVMVALPRGERDTSRGLQLCDVCLPGPEEPQEVSEAEAIRGTDPAGSTLDRYALPEPEGEWAYEVDKSGVHYGPGRWPFYRDGGPVIVRISPNTEYRSWSNQYVLVGPTADPRIVSALLHCYVRPQGKGGIVRSVRVEFDIVADTFKLIDCPAQITWQAATNAKRILGLIIAARADREVYARPLTAYDRWKAAQDGGEPERERRSAAIVESPNAAIQLALFDSLEVR